MMFDGSFKGWMENSKMLRSSEHRTRANLVGFIEDGKSFADSLKISGRVL